MNSLRRLWPLWPLCLLMAFVPHVQADDSTPAAKKPAASTTPASATSAAAKPAATAGADDELLEFLGSVGEEADGEWIDYLAKTDIAKAAKAKNKSPAATDTSSK